MAEKTKYGGTLVSSRKDETLTYTRYVKDEESGESVQEMLDKKFNKADKVTTDMLADGSVTTKKIADESITNDKIANGAVDADKIEDHCILPMHISGTLQDLLFSIFLARDGSYPMTGTLNMGNRKITRCVEVNNCNPAYGTYIRLSDASEIDFGYRSANGDNTDEQNMVQITPNYLAVVGGILAKSYTINNRSYLGLLANDGTQLAPATESEVVSLASGVLV